MTQFLGGLVPLHHPSGGRGTLVRLRLQGYTPGCGGGRPVGRGGLARERADGHRRMDEPAMHVCVLDMEYVKHVTCE